MINKQFLRFKTKFMLNDYTLSELQFIENEHIKLFSLKSVLRALITRKHKKSGSFSCPQHAAHILPT